LHKFQSLIFLITIIDFPSVALVFISQST